MEKNVSKFYWYRLTKFGLFHIAVLVIFYQQRGLSFSQIMLLQSVYYFAKVLSEVPTGAWADRVGRKKSLVIGSLFHSSAYLLIFLSHSFILFNVGEIIAGVAMSFASGADSALAYDSLKCLGRENEYKRIEGNATSVRYLAYAVFAPVGGVLATLNLALPYLASSVVVFLSGLIALTMTEPSRERKSVQGSPPEAGPPSAEKFKVQRKTFQEIENSLKLLLEDKRRLWFVLFFSLIFLATRLGFWTYQPYMEMVGLPLSLFGLVFAALYLFSAFWSKYADYLEKKAGENLTLFLMPVLVIVPMILLSRFVYLWSLSFFLILQVTFGTHEPILKNHLNRICPSEVRATMLSVQNMVGNLVFAVFAPFLGSFVDLLGLQNALLIFALVVIILGLVMWQLKRSWFITTKLRIEPLEEKI
jgi:MFS family permease